MEKKAMMGGKPVVEDPPKILDKIKLAYKDARSDKVYNVSLLYHEALCEFVVSYEYGRAGTSLHHGVKYNGDNEVKAKDTFKKLVSSKMSKGYEVVHKSKSKLSASASSAAIPKKAKEKFGVMPQLLSEINHEIEDHILEDLLKSEQWVMMPKHDGVRRMYKKYIKKGEKLTQADVIKVKAGNKKGEDVHISLNRMEAISNFPFDSMILDGEDFGEYYVVFDIILNEVPFGTRMELLKEAFKKVPKSSKLRLTDCYYTEEAKRKALSNLEKCGAEGVVFIKLSSLYTPGRSHEAIKYKFTATASFVVLSIHPTKSSIGLGLFDDEYNMHNVGNATVYPNLDEPKVGNIVEVKYLYAFKGGSIFQPVLLGTRNDVTAAECTMSQLKYKKE